MINRKYRLLPFSLAGLLILLRIGVNVKVLPPNILITGWLQPVVFASLMVAYVVLAFPSLQGKRFLCTVRRYHVESLKNQNICGTCGLGSTKVEGSGWFQLNPKRAKLKSEPWEDEIIQLRERAHKLAVLRYLAPIPFWIGALIIFLVYRVTQISPTGQVFINQVNTVPMAVLTALLYAGLGSYFVVRNLAWRIHRQADKRLGEEMRRKYPKEFETRVLAR
jgi:hypothetical protein